MPTPLSENPEYPYQPHTTAARATEEALRGSYSPFFWRWFVRCVIAAPVVLILATVVFAFLAYRIASRSWRVAELEQLGCYVRYGNEPLVEDALPAFLRERFGDHWWSDVHEVSQWSFGIRPDNATNDNLKAICQACAGLPRLKSFVTNNPHFSFQQISNWPHLNRLEAVDIKTATLSQDDLAVIAKMSGVKKLSLGGTELDAKANEQLSRLPKLETLCLSRVTFASDPRTTVPVSGFALLKRLEIDDSPLFVDEAIIALGPLPALEEVLTNRTPLGDRALAHLSASGKLHWIIMNQSHITDAGLKLLSKSPEPLVLHIANASVTNDGLGAIAGKQFDSLVLDNTAITDDGLIAMGPLHVRSYLSLDGTKVSGAGLIGLGPDQRVSWIRLEGAGVTPNGIQVLARIDVDSLCLDKTQTNDSDLMLFADNDKIASINVRQTKVTANGVRALYERRKRRLSHDGRHEHLLIVGDFPAIPAEYLPESEAWRIKDAFELP